MVWISKSGHSPGGFQNETLDVDIGIRAPSEGWSRNYPSAHTRVLGGAPKELLAMSQRAQEGERLKAISTWKPRGGRAVCGAPR